MKPQRSSMDRHRNDLRAIRRLAGTWRAGWLAGDAEKLLSLFTDRPVVLPQGRSAITGKKALRALYLSVFRQYTFKSRSLLREVRAAGDLGYLWSAYSLTATPKAGGKPVKSKGKSVFILKRTPRGHWKIARLIDNSDG